MALNSADRFPEAIAPLEKYIAAMPDDATGHYQLAMSYRHVGRKQDAEREKALQQQLSDKQQARDAAGQARKEPVIFSAPHFSRRRGSPLFLWAKG
jgi:predicted Zn-dependent protease